MSGKGGVGKTFISVNLGLSLGEGGEEVLLIDADLPSGDVAQYLGMEDDDPGLTEYLSGEIDSVEEVLKNFSGGLDVLPTKRSLRKFLSSDIECFLDFLPGLAGQYDHVIIDSPPGISRNSINPIKVSEGLLIVVNPDEASVSSAENIQRVGNILEKDLKGYILNKWKERNFLQRLLSEETQLSKDVIYGRLGTENLGTIPFDNNVRRSTQMGIPLLRYKSGSSAAKAIKNIRNLF